MGKAQKGATPALWKGKIGGLVFRQVGDETVISQMPDKKSVPDRYLDQMVQRVKMASMVNPYRLISPYFDYSFEKEKPSQNMYNLFIRYNKGANYTFLTKEEVERGAAILRPFCISQGSLDPAIGVQEKEGYYLFDLCVGQLQLSASTKLIDFSTAVIEHSPFKKLQNGDALRLYICTQMLEVGTSLPTIHCESYKVNLETNTLRAKDKLLSEFIPTGLLTTLPEADGNHLAIAAAENKMVAIVHSHRVRSKESDRIIVTTQNLFGHNELQRQFLTADRLEVAIESFGGVNKENLLAPALRQRLSQVELEADEDLDEDFGDPEEPDSPGDGSEDSGNQGGNEGGGSGGGQTPTSVEITVACTPAGGGTPNGSGSYTPGSEAQISITPSLNWNFIQWNDGDTSNPRTITVPSENTTYTATMQLNV